MGKAKKENKTEFIKVIYFDEEAAQDYLDIFNGGRKETVDAKTDEKVREVVASLEGQFGSSFNILSYLKAAISANASGKISNDVNQILVNSFKNTLLTDYIKVINSSEEDTKIKKFAKSQVYAKGNSISMYKAISSYLNIIPPEQMPIDTQKLNEAVLGERGYYEMLLEAESKKIVLRFNLKGFRNNYTLADLPKMELSFYGVKVGTCTEKQLEVGSEFSTAAAKIEPTVASIVDDNCENEEKLDIYDIVLAGVEK